MRYAILIALLMFLPVRGEAWQVVGSGDEDGPVYTDCSNIGTASFYWTGDHTSGNTIGCATSSSTVTCTVSAADFVLSATTPGTASPESGGYVVRGNAQADNFYCPVSSRNIVDMDEGQMFFDLYLATTSNNHTIVRVGGTAADELLVTNNSSGALSLSYTGNNVLVSMLSSGTVTPATWTRIGIRWSVANNKIGIKIGDGSWADDTDSDAVTAWVAQPTSFNIMRNLTYANVTYIDNVRLYKTSGY